MRCAWIVIASVALGGCEWCDDPPPPIRPEACIAPRGDDLAGYEADSSSTDTCDDPGAERNDDLSEATTGLSATCESEWSGHIRDDLDVDVFRTGDCNRDRITDLVKTEISAYADFRPSSKYMRLCVFPMCHSGATQLYRCEGDPATEVVTNGDETETVSVVWPTRLESGFNGCCRVGPGSVNAIFGCKYRSREVDTFFWVDAGTDTASCSSYYFSFTIDP